MLPHWRWTFIADRHVHRELERDGAEIHVLPPPRDPGSTDLEHLLFALRYDGVSLAICRALFLAADLDQLEASIAAEVRRTPTGAYARRAWFLFEEITGRRLPIPDVHQGNYVPLLNPHVHVTGPIRKHRRQRIDVNLLGSVEFAPLLRWTEELHSVSGAALRARIEALVSDYDDDTVRRAISYLYTRETMASYEIESERPPRTRAERFVALLREAPRLTTLDAPTLTRLQNAMVDSRFADSGWRDEQSYVGESLDLARQRIHFVCPKPEDLPELMRGYLSMTRLLSEAPPPDPIFATAVISFAFVLLHPFTDGNGRIHRWLIHWALSRRQITPEDLVIPVSAVMLSHRREYDEALESYSTPLMGRISYELDTDGRMTVHGDTADWYRHPDLTRMAEGFWRWLRLAVDRELPDQLRFLMGLDGARREIQEIVDMPDRLIVLFIKLCRSNGGRLSQRKRERHFSMLTDDEVAQMEEVVERQFAGARD
ncbi:MAG: Fic family protein [Deltaproteobacteria bacterium]|nr:Fic family protein [Deltaproteobacteria bacterium]